MKRSHRSPSYTIRNPYGYCFRLIVPRDLRKFVGKAELRYTLGTGYAGLAKSKARLLAGQIQEFFRKVREIIELDEIKDQKIQEIVNRWFNNFIIGLENMRVGEGQGHGKVFREVNRLNQSVSGRAKTALVECDYQFAWPTVKAILEKEGLEAKIFSGTHNKICREVLKSQIKFGEIEDRRNNGDYSVDLEKIFPLPSNQKAELPVSTTMERTSGSVQKMLDAYWNEHLPNWKPRAATQYRTCHKHLLVFLGQNRMIHTIDYDDGSNYKDLLLNTKKKDGDNLSSSRVDLYLGYASQIFKWAKRNYRKDVEINTASP